MTTMTLHITAEHVADVVADVDVVLVVHPDLGLDAHSWSALAALRGDFDPIPHGTGHLDRAAYRACVFVTADKVTDALNAATGDATKAAAALNADTTGASARRVTT